MFYRLLGVFRCPEHFQGDKCRREDGHSGNHASPFREWGANLPPEPIKRVRVKRKARVMQVLGPHGKFVAACRQWNREHGHIVGVRSAASEVERLDRKKSQRLVESGRRYER